MIRPTSFDCGYLAPCHSLHLAVGKSLSQKPEERGAEHGILLPDGLFGACDGWAAASITSGVRE
jgi:hypothetical protein